jgi:hypothetical protein
MAQKTSAPTRSRKLSSVPPPAEPTETDRQQMIAERAYQLAEQRGFEPGAELEDWLAAEREVDAKLGRQPS